MSSTDAPTESGTKFIAGRASLQGSYCRTDVGEPASLELWLESEESALTELFTFGRIAPDGEPSAAIRPALRDGCGR